MAISPDKLARPNVPNAQVVATVERNLDEYLTKIADDGWFQGILCAKWRYAPTNLATIPDRPTRFEIGDRYRAVGWWCETSESGILLSNGEPKVDYRMGTLDERTKDPRTEPQDVSK